MRALFKGIRYSNDKAHVVTEYFFRKSLAELGYTFSADTLTMAKATEFHMIAGEVAMIRAELMNRGSKGG